MTQVNFFLYIRSILEDIGIPQEEATIIYKDNKAAIAMANAGRPTKRTKHIDTRFFALQSWVEQDLILLKSIPTNDSSSEVVLFNKVWSQIFSDSVLFSN